MTDEEREKLKASTFAADVIRDSNPPVIRITGVISGDFLEKMRADGSDSYCALADFFGEAVCDAVTRAIDAEESK